MELLTRNVAALRLWNPQAAALISCAEIPPEWQRTAAADGALSFRCAIDTPPRRVDWLGNTSAPRAAAGSLVHDMEPGVGSALGLGIGTGYEWLALLARLGSHQSLFVLEPDAVACRMVLEVCALEAPLQAGRLVLLVGAAAGAQLSAFLQSHSGFDVPQVLHVLPSLPLERRHALRVAGDAMLQQAIRERTGRGAAVLGQLQEYAPQAAAPRLAFIARPEYPGQRLLSAVLERERAAGREVSALDVGQHASTSLLARLELLARHRPAQIDADFFRAQLGMGVPQNVAVHTWVPPLAPLSYFQPDRLPDPSTMAAADRVVVHSQEHQEVLSARGFAAERIDLVPPIAPLQVELASGPRTAVALLGDVPPVEPDAYGLELPSHLALWAALRALIEEAPFEALAHRTPDLLRRAQRRANVTLDDPQLLATFERGVRHGLLRGAVLLATARLLAGARVNLRLIGRGWQAAGLADRAPGVGYGPQMFAGVATLLHVDPAAIVHPLVLTAAAAGIRVVSVEHPRAGSLGGVATLGIPCAVIRPRELLRTL